MDQHYLGAHSLSNKSKTIVAKSAWDNNNWWLTYNSHSSRWDWSPAKRSSASQAFQRLKKRSAPPSLRIRVKAFYTFENVFQHFLIFGWACLSKKCNEFGSWIHRSTLTPACFWLVLEWCRFPDFLVYTRVESCLKKRRQRRSRSSSSRAIRADYMSNMVVCVWVCIEMLTI